MKRVFGMSVVASLAGCATPHANLSTHAHVDLNKYAGTWYEQARLPNRFQKNCAGDVQANYALKPDETITVTNQCRKKDGSTDVATGEGRLSKAFDPRDSSKLEVRFAPKWTSWIPMVWGDYWIIKLDERYQYSLVGTPDRKYLWVLSRDKQADQVTVSQLLEYARAQGFDVGRVIMASD